MAEEGQPSLTEEQHAEVRDKAIEHMSDINLHRRLTLPANPSAERPDPLKVSFADVGAIPSPSEGIDPPVLLIASPLMAGRLHMARIGEKAKTYGVRVICIDKAGTGGSDPVPINQKTSVWLEAVEAVLDHIKVKNISLACHSAGAIHAASVLLYLRHLLEPVNYVAFMTPWVSPRHGSSFRMQLANILPASAIGSWPLVFKFMVEKGFPFLNKTWYPFTDRISRLLYCLKPRKLKVRETQRFYANEEAAKSAESSPPKPEDLYSRRVREELSYLAFKYTCAEALAGFGLEAQFCLKKGGGPDVWGGWIDYDQMVKLLVANERPFASERMNKLRVDVFHAAEDNMVGKRGQRWFDSCWKPEVIGEDVEYNATVVEDTNHDTINEEDSWVLDKMFERIIERVGKAEPVVTVEASSDANPISIPLPRASN